MKKSTRIVGKLRGLSIAFGVALIALSPVWCNLLYQWGTSTTVRITVTGKERVTFSTGSGENRKTGSKYLVLPVRKHSRILTPGCLANSHPVTFRENSNWESPIPFEFMGGGSPLTRNTGTSSGSKNENLGKDTRIFRVC